MENKTAEEILDEHGCPELPYDETVCMKHYHIIEAMETYAKQERLKGITEGFNAAKIIVEVGAENQPLYPILTDYLNSKNKP